MKANRAYELIVSREGIEPAFMASPERLDRIEVVSLDDGEVVLYWQVPAKRAAQLVRELRADLASLDAEHFISSWEGAEGEGAL